MRLRSLSGEAAGPYHVIMQDLTPISVQAVLKKTGSKKALWEQVRSLFHCFKLESIEMLHRAILHGCEIQEHVIRLD